MVFDGVLMPEIVQFYDGSQFLCWFELESKLLLNTPICDNHTCAQVSCINTNN